MAEPLAFNWKDHLALDPNLGEYSDEVSAVLDQLALTPEGRELITSAHTQYNDVLERSGPIPVFAADKMNAGSKFDTAGLKLDFDEIRQTTISTRQGDQPLGLANTIVHELFHGTDPNMRPEVNNAAMRAESLQIDDIVSSNTVPIVTRYELFDRLMQEADARLLRDGITPAFQTDKDVELRTNAYNGLLQDKAALAPILADLNIDPASIELNPTGSGRYGKALYLQGDPNLVPAIGTIDNSPFMRNREEDATDYADAYMAKYYNAPQRIDYDNAKVNDVLDLGITVPSFDCSAGNMPTYIGEIVAAPDGTTFHQPSITPDVSCEDVVNKQR